MTKLAALEKVFKDTKKKYGEGAAYRLDEIPPYDIVSSGSLSLDFATGIGGWPSNRVIEFAGPPGVGKTTLVLNGINNYLEKYPNRGVTYLDLEHRLEKDWAKKFVTDWDRFVYLAPKDVETATNMFRDWGETGDISAQVFDSIGSAPTSRSLEKDAHIASMGGNSGAITNFARFATTYGGIYNFTTFGLNQIRADFGGYNRHLVPGGKGWEHACSIRIQLKPGKKGEGEYFETINGEEIKMGKQIYAKIVKSSVGTEGRVGNYWIYNRDNKRGTFGIDQVEEIVRISKLVGVVEGTGWMKHHVLPGGKVQGVQAFSDFLKSDRGALEVLRKETWDVMNSGNIDMSQIVPTEDPEKGIEEPESFAGARTIQQIREQSNEA